MGAEAPVVPCDRFPVEAIPPGWELVTLVGGRHDGTRMWSHRPPRRFRVVEGGDVYEQAPDGVYVAEGAPYEPVMPGDDQQMSLG